MKLSDVICTFIIERGIKVIFGIIGSANSHIYDSLHKYNIKVINVHHEQSAVIAAGAYYRTTGKIAVALVTAGGGASNSITGIVSTWADSIPVIIFAGQESSFYLSDHSNHRMYGTQGFDFVHMVSKITKYANTITESTMIQDELEKCYSIAMNGRKGPTVLEIPFNMQCKDIEHRAWNKFVSDNGTADFKYLKEIQELIYNSKRPIILAGHGIKLSNSIELFEDRIKHIRMPVLLTWSAIDILDNEHPLYFGRPGVYGQRAANFILQKCDLLIALGSRLTIPQTGYDFDEFARLSKIVMIDIDTTEFKNFAHMCINIDCKEFLKQISNITYSNDLWLDECKELSNRFPLIEDSHKDDKFPNSYRIIDRMSDFLKSDQIIVTDMGTALLSGHQVIRLKKGQTMFTSYGLGEMGYGLPAALGSAISSPNREVLCLNCDGGMMMNLQELQTIIQHKLKIKIVIFNNDGYLMIKHTQKTLFKSYTSIDSDTGIVLPDYINIGNAFGYKTYCIKTWDEFNLYFPKFMNYEHPAICEIYMPPSQDFIPKVKGVVDNKGFIGCDSSIFAPPLEEMSPLLDYNTIKDIMKNNVSKKSEQISRF